jgi:ABC-2 type transport system ATP-binding protein
VSGFTEETETLEIELVEGADEVAAELRRRGLAPRLDGRRLLLEDVSGHEYDVVRDAVVDVGALLYRLAPARHSLADVFAGEATGEDSPDAARETSG